MNLACSTTNTEVTAGGVSYFLEAIAGCEPGVRAWGEQRKAPKNKNLVTDFTEGHVPWSGVDLGW